MVDRISASRWRRVEAETAVLLLASAAMMGLLIWAGWHLTFWYDEWSIILDRPDPSAATLLAPHVDHLSVVPIAIYQMLLRIVGLTSYWPYLAVTWAGHFTSVWLLYRIIGRRADRRLALLAAISLLALGSAFEDLLHAWQMSFLLSTAGGLLALDQLDADATPRATAIAAGSLLFAVAASSVGVIILGVILAWGVLARQRRVIVATAPAILLYAVWYAMWGHTGAGSMSAEAGLTVIAGSLAFGLGAAVAAIAGLPPLTYAPIGFVIGALAAIRGWMQGLRLSALGLAACLGLVAMYLLQALFRADFGIEHAARSAYLYPAAMLLWLAVGDALAGLPLPRTRSASALIILTVVALAVVGNLAQFHGAATAMRGLRLNEVAVLGLVEQLRDSPGLALDRSPDEELVPQVTPRRYFVAIDRFGPPALDTTGTPLQQADAARLNRAALVLLGDSFSVGPSHPTGSAPIIHLDGTGGVVVVADGCAIVRIQGEGQVMASWMVAPATGFRLDGELAPHARLLLGVDATSPQPAPTVVGTGLATGGGILPPTLPIGLSWYAQLEVSGPGSLRVCSVVADTVGILGGHLGS